MLRSGEADDSAVRRRPPPPRLLQFDDRIAERPARPHRRGARSQVDAFLLGGEARAAAAATCRTCPTAFAACGSIALGALIMRLLPRRVPRTPHPARAGMAFGGLRCWRARRRPGAPGGYCCAETRASCCRRSTHDLMLNIFLTAASSRSRPLPSGHGPIFEQDPLSCHGDGARLLGARGWSRREVARRSTWRNPSAGIRRCAASCSREPGVRRRGPTRGARARQLAADADGGRPLLPAPARPAARRSTSKACPARRWPSLARRHAWQRWRADVLGVIVGGDRPGGGGGAAQAAAAKAESSIGIEGVVLLNARLRRRSRLHDALEDARRRGRAAFRRRPPTLTRLLVVRAA